MENNKYTIRLYINPSLVYCNVIPKTIEQINIIKELEELGYAKQSQQTKEIKSLVNKNKIIELNRIFNLHLFDNNIQINNKEEIGNKEELDNNFNINQILNNKNIYSYDNFNKDNYIIQDNNGNYYINGLLCYQPVNNNFDFNPFITYSLSYHSSNPLLGLINYRIQLKINIYMHCLDYNNLIKNLYPSIQLIFILYDDINKPQNELNNISLKDYLINNFNNYVDFININNYIFIIEINKNNNEFNKINFQIVDISNPKNYLYNIFYPYIVNNIPLINSNLCPFLYQIIDNDFENNIIINSHIKPIINQLLEYNNNNYKFSFNFNTNTQNNNIIIYNNLNYSTINNKISQNIIYTDINILYNNELKKIKLEENDFEQKYKINDLETLDKLFINIKKILNYYNEYNYNELLKILTILNYLLDNYIHFKYFNNLIINDLYLEKYNNIVNYISNNLKDIINYNINVKLLLYKILMDINLINQ